MKSIKRVIFAIIAIIILLSGCASKPETDPDEVERVLDLTDVEEFDFEEHEFVLEIAPSDAWAREIISADRAIVEAEKLWRTKKINDYIFFLSHSDNHLREIKVFYDSKTDVWLIKYEFPENSTGYCPTAYIKSDGNVLALYV